MSDVTNRRTDVITIWLGQRLSGFAAYQPDRWEGQDVTFLLELHLNEELRGVGIGKRLLWAVEHASRDGGRDGMVLRVSRHNRDALTFYERQPQLEVSPVSMAEWATPEVSGEQHDHYQYIWEGGARDAILQRAKRQQRAYSRWYYEGGYYALGPRP